MALTVHVPEGGDIYIGDLHFDVRDIGARGSAFTLVERRQALDPMRVDQHHSGNFFAGTGMVCVYSAINTFWATRPAACLRIQADLSVTILRGDLYRKNGSKFIVSSQVREAIAKGHVPYIRDILHLIELATAGIKTGATVKNGNVVFIVDGPVIIGVSKNS